MSLGARKTLENGIPDRSVLAYEMPKLPGGQAVELGKLSDMGCSTGIIWYMEGFGSRLGLSIHALQPTQRNRRIGILDQNVDPELVCRFRRPSSSDFRSIVHRTGVRHELNTRSVKAIQAKGQVTVASTAFPLALVCSCQGYELLSYAQKFPGRLSYPCQGPWPSP